MNSTQVRCINFQVRVEMHCSRNWQMEHLNYYTEHLNHFHALDTRTDC